MKSILVTGGSGGIGEAICKEMAKAGYFVGVHYNKSKDKAEALAKEIGGISVGFEVSNFAEVKSGVNEFAKRAGGIDALVCTAGVAQLIKPIIDTTESEYDEIFNTNMKGVFLCNREVIPYMIEKGGVIVNVSSMWGLVGASCEGVYSASKSAVLGFTKSLAKEYSSAKIRVNAVAPGFIDTPMNDNLSASDRLLAIGDIPLGRVGLPEDVAKCVRFLVDEDTFITGEIINISGGEVII